MILGFLQTTPVLRPDVATRPPIGRTAPAAAQAERAGARVPGGVSASFSPEAQAASARAGLAANAAPSGSGALGNTQLTPEEEAQVRELKRRDAEVRRHEQAHVAVGGQYSSAPRYEFQRGPDGRQYAVGGEVSIDTSEGRTPEATIQKMQVVQRAALAPAEPSAQDRRVAAQAARTETQARRELQQQRAEEARDGEDAPTRTAGRIAAFGGAEATPAPSVNVFV